MLGGDVKKRAVFDLAAIIGIELVIAAVVLRTGFVAVSDDDFSRVVIGQKFAAAPSLDPSGTSWLPLPFVILGAAMAALGRSLAVARAVAIAEAVAALLLVHRAARNLSLSERAAFAGAGIAAIVPTAARLGVSFQPEALTAGLVVFGASTLATSAGAVPTPAGTPVARAGVFGLQRSLGGVALGAASLCRYEAWPAAFVFAALCAAGVFRAQKRRGLTRPAATAGHESAERGAVATASFLAAAVAILPAAAWMLHGALSHGSPVFFLHRVAAYRKALGDAEPAWQSVVAYPAALFRSEPELAVLGLVVIAVAAQNARTWLSTFARPALVFAGVAAFLVAGRLVGGAPTHHDERPLLPFFWALSIVVADYVFGDDTVGGAGTASEVETPEREPRPRRLARLALAFAAVATLLRFGRPGEPFAPRTNELAIGSDAKRLVGPSDHLLVQTNDYGYFAVIAAFGAPERAEPFDRHDPREARALDAFATPEALRSRLAASGAAWLVAPRDREAVAIQCGTIAARNDEFELLRVARTAR